MNINAVKALINKHLEDREMEKALSLTNELVEKFPDLKEDKKFSRFHQKMIDNLSLKDRLGRFVFDKKQD